MFDIKQYFIYVYIYLPLNIYIYFYFFGGVSNSQSTCTFFSVNSLGVFCLCVLLISHFVGNAVPSGMVNL